MDSLRGFDDDGGWSAVAEDEPAVERPPEIGVDERRMHVRAYNYWVSLLDGRPYPSIEDLKPERIGDFGPHSVLLDFSNDAQDPDIAFLGASLRKECGLEVGISRISEVPTRSLLSRLTDHYLQILANRAPIGFEAEFTSHYGANTLYRGILMPLSTDGDGIDFVYGVINWKELADSQAVEIAGEVDRAVATTPARGDLPVWADGPHGELDAPTEEKPTPAEETLNGEHALELSLWPEPNGAETAIETPAQIAEDAALAERLKLARASAERARGADHRSRAALYRALEQAYDFALATAERPDEYADLLAAAGVKVQARAPMTPVAKLVFGSDYDKTRLTEFAAGLSFAKRQALEAGSFAGFLDSMEGGLKGVVAAERAARRPTARPDKTEDKRARLRVASALAVLDAEEIGSAPAGELVLLLARAEGGGRIAVVAPLIRDEKLIKSALAKAAA